MDKNQLRAQFSELFQKFDTEKKRYITLEEFNQSFLQSQYSEDGSYSKIQQVFQNLSDGRMDENAFVSAAMAGKIDLLDAVVLRLKIEKQLKKYASAVPNSNANEKRKSSIKCYVASKKKNQPGEKNRVSASVGYDNPEQTKRFQLFKKVNNALTLVLGRKPSQMVGLIKFKVDGAHEQIRSGIETVIETVKSMLLQMDKNIAKKMKLVYFTVKVHENYIYIFAQMTHSFFQDFAGFMNEIIPSLNAQGNIKFFATLQSNYLKKILKQGQQNKLHDLDVQLGLQTDSQIMDKLKLILFNSSQSKNKPRQKYITLILFQQINIQGSFSNSQKVLQQSKIKDILGWFKQKLIEVKDMNLKQNLQAYVPNFNEFIDMLKNNAYGDGQVSVNILNCYFKIEFKIQMEDLFDLL